MKWWQIRKRDTDLERELQSDLQLEEEEQRERGIAPEEARHAALRAFGNPTVISEQTPRGLELGQAPDSSPRFKNHHPHARAAAGIFSGGVAGDRRWHGRDYLAVHRCLVGAPETSAIRPPGATRPDLRKRREVPAQRCRPWHLWRMEKPYPVLLPSRAL